MLPLENSPQRQSAMKLEGNTLIVKSVTHDDAILAHNKAHRLNQTRRSGKSDLKIVHPKGAKISYHFAAPPDLWNRCVKQYPDMFAALKSGDYMARELAAQAIAKVHPEWVVTAPNMHLID